MMSLANLLYFDFEFKSQLRCALQSRACTQRVYALEPPLVAPAKCSSNHHSSKELTIRRCGEPTAQVETQVGTLPC